MEEPFDLRGTICLKDAIHFVEPGRLPGRKERAAVGNISESKWMFTFAYWPLQLPRTKKLGGTWISTAARNEEIPVGHFPEV